MPGSEQLGWAVESGLDDRDWPLALSPADTDLLLVVGTPGPRLAAAVDLLWSQVPQPRHRFGVTSTDHLDRDLEAAAEALVEEAARPEPPADEDVVDHAPEGGPALADAGMDHVGMDHGGMDHGGMEHAGMEPAGMEPAGMDHGGMHMHHGGDVAGLPMATTAPDRDGLDLDVLHVSLGPVLPGWPPGLLLRADLQGDVLTGAQLEWLDPVISPQDGHDADARRIALDRLASFLTVAGWPTAAREARRARDGLGAGDPASMAAAGRRAERLARRVRRSRALAWSVRGIGSPAAAEAGDALDRVRRWCDVAAGRGGPVPSPTTLGELGQALEGTELAAARLLVASVEPERTTASEDTHALHA